MRIIWTIATRDFKAYFVSPIAYIVTGIYMALMGIFFHSGLEYFHRQAMQYNQFGGRGEAANFVDHIIRPTYGNMNVLFLFIVPFITMRLFSEEKKLHTLEMLMTAPVKTHQMVLGKFLSSMMLVGLMLLLTSIFPIILFATGNPHWGAIFTNYLGTLLMASCCVSLGMLFSSMTENQIIAGALGFGAGLFFWIINMVAYSLSSTGKIIVEYFSLIGHFDNFSKGVINSSDLIYFLSFIFVTLFMTHRVIDSYRWR
ncbi:MAG: hypothetical protein CL678_17940 [Bdellovibrionaceae bacterium]|nr:hypothetical protein [Pseudobdellovibrionaceae bacterium]|tara:strand:+ start:680 stop:1447 length:768 start_codon:yes stop_codon:yes gene_type:complete